MLIITKSYVISSIQLVTVNENLEKENKILKEGGITPNKGERQANEAQDEVRRLQAQNSALQKTLTCKSLLYLYKYQKFS